MIANITSAVFDCEGHQFFGERRGEVRFVLNIPAKVKGLNPVTSIGPSLPATIVEGSRHGHRIRLDREYLPGASIQVLVSKKAFVGKVRHCFRSGIEFMVGVQLFDGIPSAAKEGGSNGTS